MERESTLSCQIIPGMMLESGCHPLKIREKLIIIPAKVTILSKILPKHPKKNDGWNQGCVIWNGRGKSRKLLAIL